MYRFVVLAINSFNHIENKTGNMLIRYRQNEVVAVIDPEKKGLTSKDVIGIGESIPVVESFNDAMKYNPDHLVIGNAPQGGIVSKHMYLEIEEAIKNFISKGLRTHDIASDATFLRTDQVAPKLIDIIEEISSAR